MRDLPAITRPVTRCEIRGDELCVYIVASDDRGRGSRSMNGAGSRRERPSQGLPSSCTPLATLGTAD
jgi:hypothetical protein